MTVEIKDLRLFEVGSGIIMTDNSGELEGNFHHVFVPKESYKELSEYFAKIGV